jgi:hypothetical protein
VAALLTAVVTERHPKRFDAHTLGTRMATVLWALGDTFPDCRVFASGRGALWRTHM